MKSILITACLLVMTICVMAANREVDSVRQLLNAAPNDTSRVMLLSEMSRVYNYSKPDSAMKYAQQGLQLAEKIKFKRGEAKCLSSIGLVLQVVGNYPKALETFLKVLQIREGTGDRFGIATSNNHIGNVYDDMGDYAQSLSYYFKALWIADSLRNQDRMFVERLNIGDTYEKLNKLDSALMYSQQAYEMGVRMQDRRLNIVLGNLGNIQSKLGNHSLALDYYRLSIAASQDQNDDQVISEDYLGIAKIYASDGNQDSSLYYARQSYYTAAQGSNAGKVLIAGNYLLNFYEKANNTDSAFHYAKIVMTAKDSLFSEQKVQQVQTISFNEQLRQSEIREDKAKSDEERKNNLQLIGIAIFIVTFVSFVIALTRTKKQYRALEFMGLLALLLVFEFISLFVHPFIEEATSNNPIMMLIILVAIASVLVPTHHSLSLWMKQKASEKKMSRHVAENVPQT